MSTVKVALWIEVHDPAAVEAVGDKVIRDGWGYDSIAAYQEEVEDDLHPVARSLYEIVTAGLWDTLAQNGAAALVCEIVNDDVEEV